LAAAGEFIVGSKERSIPTELLPWKLFELEFSMT
jgi:hypothetical protein